MSKPISESDLRELVNALQPAKHKWKKIGTNLIIAPSELEAIQCDNNDSGERLHGMLIKWIASADNPTWKNIVDALRTQSVGESRLSEKIRKRYCRRPGIYIYIYIYIMLKPALHADCSYKLIREVFRQTTCCNHVTIFLYYTLYRWNTVTTTTANATATSHLYKR